MEQLKQNAAKAGVKSFIQEGTVERMKSFYRGGFPENPVQVQNTRKDFEGDITVVVFPFLRYSKKAPEQTAEDIGKYLVENIDTVEKAKQLLKLAGHPKGIGIPEISITVKNKTISRQVGEFFSQEMRKIGIKVKLDAVTWPKLMEKAQKGNYSIFYSMLFLQRSLPACLVDLRTGL